MADRRGFVLGVWGGYRGTQTSTFSRRGSQRTVISAARGNSLVDIGSKMGL